MIELIKKEHYSVFGLFPTPVMVFNIRELTKKEKEKLFLLSSDAYVKKVASGNKKSKVAYVLEDKELKDLRKEFLNCITEFDKVVFSHNNDVNYEITQSWLNVYNQDDHQAVHTHSNSVLSAVFYLQTNNDEIWFTSRHLQTYPYFHVEEEKYNMFNSEEVFFSADQNKLFVFPSTLFHSVPHKKTDNVRISLSFNTKITGSIGDPNSLTYCELN